MRNSKWKPTLNRQKQMLVMDEPIEAPDFGKITNHFRGTLRVYHNFSLKKKTMPTCYQLELETLGSQLAMPKNLLGH